MSRRRFAAFGGCERGTAAIEFAIISVVFITMLVGMVDFGRTLYIKNQLALIADTAARQALIDPDVPDATLEAQVADQFTAGDPAALTVTLGNLAFDGAPFRELTVSYPMTLFIPNLSSNAIELSITRRVPVL